MNTDENSKMSLICHLCVSVFICGLLLPLTGCKSAVQAGQNSALSGVDLVKMTDDMAMQLGSDPEVQQAIRERGPLKIVVLPVENRMRAEVLPRGPAEAFVARVRALLSRQARENYVWIMNRDAWYSLRERQLDDVDIGPSPDAVNPDYSLSAVFSSLAEEDKKHRSSYYLCRYELTDLRDRTVLWEGSYEVRKVAVKGFGD